MAGTARPSSPVRLRVPASPALFLAALAVVVVLRPQGDPDYWWHVRVGDWILEHQAVPHTELLSWLSGGGSWTAPSWGSEVILAVLDRLTGTAGSVVLFLGVTIGILLLVAAIARHVRPSLGPGALAALAFVTALVATPVWGPRAQMWDVLFVLAALLGMLRYLDTGQVRGLVAMPFLMVAWTNLHGAGTLVYLLLAAGVIAGEFWNRRAWRRRARPWRPLLLSIAVTILAISLNPYGPWMYVYGFTTTASGPTADLILEWQSPNFHTLAMRPAQLLLAFGLVGAMAFVRIRDARIAVLVAGFTFMFLQSGRYVEFMAPMALALMGPAMLTALTRIAVPVVPFRLHFHDGHRRFVGVVGGLVGVVLLAWRLATVPALESEALLRDQPVAAAAWLADQPQSGRLFSEYGWGGYLAYRLGIQVGPYGASDAFGDKVLGEVGGLFGGSVDPGKYLDANAIDTMVVRGDSAIGHYLAASPSWRRLFGDKTATVFGRAAPVTP
jgi:hypothetical protein